MTNQNYNDNSICLYIHGIGKENKVENTCQKIEQHTGIKTIPIIWWDLFDKYETEFIELYGNKIDFIRKFAIYYAGDVVIYEKMKEIIFNKLSKELNEYSSYKINIIAHSLGSVIISDFLYDNKDVKINNLFTIGSPLALYSLRYGIKNFDKPIKNCNNWINIWNKYDAISFPLKCLNIEYANTVNKDIMLNCGSIFLKIFRLAHTSYFNYNELYKIIKNKMI